MSIPGELHYQIHQDFKITDASVGKGGTAAITKGIAINQRIIQAAKGQDIVIKAFNNQGFLGEDIRFELAIMGMFHHPNVIELIGFTDDPPYILMQCHYGSLFDLILSGNSEHIQSVKYIRDIAYGLAGKFMSF
jgi:hypothetical protein